MTSCAIINITRKECFSAAHRLHSPHLSDEVNKDIFGKCNSENGHGHNYTVEVTIRGPIDLKTGMVMNLTDLKACMDSAIMKQLDHKNIDKDVMHFQKIPSTTENVAVFIWDSLKSKLPKPELLFEVKLYETDKNFVSYRGKMRNGTQNGGRPFDRRASENVIAFMSSDSD
ncbi:unnamed protein product [Diamesa hyperborea]